MAKNPFENVLTDVKSNDSSKIYFLEFIVRDVGGRAINPETNLMDPKVVSFSNLS